MHVAKAAVPVTLSAPGAPARQLEGFGDADVILCSPHVEHVAVLDHMAGLVEGMPA